MADFSNRTQTRAAAAMAGSRRACFAPLGPESRQVALAGTGEQGGNPGDGGAGADFVLRLHLPERVNVRWLRSELTWLSMLRRRTDLLAPFPISAQVDGGEELLIELRHDRLPPPAFAYAALFEFIEGELKSARDLGPVDVFRVGEYLGNLHRIGQFSPPAGFDRPGLHWEGLFGDEFSLRLAN